MSTTTTARPVQLPAGATRMSLSYLDEQGSACRAEWPVPVGADDRRTAHRRHRCSSPRHIEINGERVPCDQIQWLTPDDPDRFCPDHGDRMMPAESVTVRRGPMLPWADVRSALRPHLPPWVVLSTEIVGGIGAHNSGMPPLAVAAIASPVLGFAAHRKVLTYLRKRAEGRERIEEGQDTGRRVETIRRRARYAAYMGSASGLWLGAASAVDPATIIGKVAWSLMPVSWAIGAGTWWRYQRDLSNRPEPEQVLEVEDPEVEVDLLPMKVIAQWDLRIGGKDKILAGTTLVDVRRLPGQGTNWAARIESVPGELDLSDPPSRALGLIAGAYRCGTADITLDGVPGDASQAMILVQQDNPLAPVQHWQGPDIAEIMRSGRSFLGPYADGEESHYVWFNAGGPWHDLICGCTGSGKSELVTMLIVTELLSEGLMLSWVADPQQGQSYGELQDHVDWFARSIGEIRLMLLAAVKEMMRRNKIFSKSRQKTWRPTQEYPLLVITIDEAHDVLKDDVCRQLVVKLANMARKCGIKLRIITQVPLLDQLGGSTPIKDALVAGQIIVLRTGSAISSQGAVQGAAEIHPHRLPKVWPAHTACAGQTTAGLGYLLGVETRNARIRTVWPGDDLGKWIRDHTKQLVITPGAMSQDAIDVSGPLWGGRIARAEAFEAAPLRDEDILPNGQAVALIQEATQFQASGKLGGMLAGGTVSADGTGNEITMPTFGAPVSAGKVGAKTKVLAAAVRLADENGRVTRKAIVDGLARDVAGRTVTDNLVKLIGEGMLVNGGDIPHGSYAVTEKGRVASSAAADLSIEKALNGNLEAINV